MANIAKINGIVPAKVNGIVPAKVNGMGFSSEFYPYPTPDACRFNGTDEDMSKTFGSSGTQTTFTISAWIKGVKETSSQQVLFCKESPDGAGACIASEKPLFVWRPGNNISTVDAFSFLSCWSHVVFVFDSTEATETDRIRIFVNGVEQALSGTYPTLNQSSLISSANSHVVASWGGEGSGYLDGYIAGLYFLDGLTLRADSFGEAYPGVWVPKEYTGSYGTNGFHLDFSDASALGKDVSGNGNDFTEAGIDSSNQVEDTPTNNFCTLDPNAANGATISSGNLVLAGIGAGGSNNPGTFALSSGKWYFEAKATFSGAGWGYMMYGVEAPEGVDSYFYGNANQWCYRDGETVGEGHKQGNSGGWIEYGTGHVSGDTVMCAFDVDAGKIWFGTNGTWHESGNPAAGTDEAFSGLADALLPAFYTFYASDYWEVNFGNPTQSIASGDADENGHGNFEYEPPAGFLALCEANADSGVIAPMNLITGNEAYDASEENGEHTADCAADGNGSSYWEIATGGIGDDIFWWEVDFGVVSTEKALLASVHMAAGAAYSSDVKIKGSNDRSSWDALSALGGGFINYTVYNFDLTANADEYRYYRVYFSYSDDNNPSIYEVQLYGAFRSVDAA